jgi:hypothetical protein
MAVRPSRRDPWRLDLTAVGGHQSPWATAVGVQTLWRTAVAANHHTPRRLMYIFYKLQNGCINLQSDIYIYIFVIQPGMWEVGCCNF